MPLKISLRPGTPEDQDFLFMLKKKTLKEYVTQIWGWDEKFQLTHHRQHAHPELYRIIQASGEDIGGIEVENRSDTLFLSVIEILPRFQGQGIGSKLIKDLIKQGKRERKNIELQVLKVNQKAFRLYTSLGFVVTAETQTHFVLMYDIS